MTACPTVEMLHDLLQDGLPPDAATTIRAHLEGCSSCLDVLDRLSDDSELNSWMAEGLGEARDDAARRAALDDLRSSRSPLSIVLLGMPERVGSIGTLGLFDIEAEIGRGGMGVVYRARDRTMERIVALKVLRPGLDDERTRQRFIREVRAAALVEHDHIVRVYATADPTDPVLYFAMEYVAGSSLAERIHNQKGLGPREAAEVVEQAARGLAAAHAAGLVHRDVKPDNILLDTVTGRAKVGDFGLARLDSEAHGLTRDGAVAGTPAYLSPEQARGDSDVGSLADVYALGVTLYECLAGEPPFRGTPQRIVQQILGDEPRTPRALNDDIPRDLETVCLKAMDKDPGRRYANASDFAADLQRWLNDEPIHARPIGPSGHLMRLVRRHPRVSALSATLIVALLAGVSGILWQWRRAEANGRQAHDYLARALDSIDIYFTRVSENRLLDVPNLQPLRRELLAAARDYYEDLLRDRPSDPKIRVELAKARARLAVVISIVGSYDEALGLLGQSRSEFDSILAERPGDLVARNARITALINTAAVQLYSSKLDDCSVTLDRLLAICEADRRDRPKAVEPLEGLYAGHYDRAQVASRRHEPAAAVASEAELAMAANRELLVRKPDHPQYLRNTSRAAVTLGESYQAIGRRAEGQAVIDEGHRVAKRLYAEHPEALDYRFSLSPYEARHGAVALQESLSLKGPAATAKLDVARRDYAFALDLVRGLVRESPQVHLYRIELLGMLVPAANIESAAGRSGPALALLREAHDVYATTRHLDDNQYGYAKTAMSAILFQEAHDLSQAGRPDDALTVLDEADAILLSLTDRERVTQGGIARREGALACTRAVILCEAGRTAESLPVWERACKLIPAEVRPMIELIRDMYRASADLGPPVDRRRAPAVVSLAHAICTSQRLPACTEVTYAKIYAMAASVSEAQAQDVLFARAVLRLEKASQAGYFQKTVRLDRVASDPVFECLKGRSDYAQFLNRSTVHGSRSSGR